MQKNTKSIRQQSKQQIKIDIDEMQKDYYDTVQSIQHDMYYDDTDFEEQYEKEYWEDFWSLEVDKIAQEMCDFFDKL